MYLNNSKQVVIKIGSSLLIDKNKNIRKNWLLNFAKDIEQLIKNKKKIIIVSSGAIALGCKKLNINKKNLKLDKSQAVASIGQIELMNLFNEIFKKRKLNLSQILLTLEDTEIRRRAINAKRTFDNLFDLGFIPLVNENDSIATSEIKYGDNDRLAARVAEMANADLLVLLSDIDGLYSADPRLEKDAEHIGVVQNITKDIEAMAGPSRSDIGSGGMNTKIEAAKIATAAGCSVIITDGASGQISVIIGNSTPAITDINLSPSSVYTNDILTATVSASDTDGDSLSYTFDWYVDGGSGPQMVLSTTQTMATHSLDGGIHFDRDAGRDLRCAADHAPE